MAENVFNKNDVEAMICKDSAMSFRLIAAHCEEHNYPASEIIKWLRELADEQEAQAIVVELRDKL
jgi:hypothetical protein